MCAVDRILFTFVNIVLGLTGATVLITAMVVHKFSYNIEITDRYSLPAVPELMYAAGSLSLLAAIVGSAVASLGRFRLLLLLYICIIAALAVVQVTASGMALTNRQTARNTTLKVMEGKMDVYMESPAVAAVWDQFQNNWKCCGLWSPFDWLLRYSKVPRSCCRDDVDSCDVTKTFHMHRDGCARRMENFVDRAVNVLAYVAIAVVVVQVMAVLFVYLMIFKGRICPFS